MKRLLVAVILAVILTMTIATPAFAWWPNTPDLPQPGEDGVNHAWNTLIWPACWGVGNGFWKSGAYVVGSPASHGRRYGNTIALLRLTDLLE